MSISRLMFPEGCINFFKSDEDGLARAFPVHEAEGQCTEGEEEGDELKSKVCLDASAARLEKRVQVVRVAAEAQLGVTNTVSHFAQPTVSLCSVTVARA